MTKPIQSLKEISSGRSDLFKIDLKHLALDPGFNARTDFGDLAILCEQIMAAGVVLKPFNVRLEGGRVLVTDGERRFRAAHMAIERGFALPPVPCVPDPRNYSEEQRTLSLILLNSGKPLRMIEQARVYRRLQDDHGWEPKRIAKETGQSRTHVANCLALFALPALTLEAIEAEKISASLVVEIIHEEKGDMEAVGKKVGDALEAAQEAGKPTATRKHVEPTASEPPAGSSPDESGKTGVEAIRAAPSSVGGGGPNQSTGEGGTADTRTDKLNKMLESTPREKCDPEIFDLLEVVVDYLENRRPLGDVKKKLLLSAS